MALAAGMLGMLGFLISGLAIMAGSLSSKLIYKINSKNKIVHLIRVLFPFYLTGFLIGLNLIFLIAIYLGMRVGLVIPDWGLMLLAFFGCYLFWFTVIYAAMLLGTSLRMMLLAYQLEYQVDATDAKVKDASATV